MNTAKVRNVRHAYAVLAWVFLACVAVQVFLAGLAIFVNPANWGRHTTFVHVFELVPLVMIVLMFIGRLPSGMRWLTVTLFVLIGLQYATADMPGSVIAALHPVNAMVLFWVSTIVVSRSRPWLSRQS